MVDEIIEKGLISLKEASKISGYSSDYVGQLIRSGKIPGKQVYSNIQWMTTAEAVMDYKNSARSKQKENISDKLVNRKRKIAMELNILKLFFNTFKLALPLILIIIVSSVILFSIIFYYLFNPGETNISNQETQEEIILTF